MVLTPTGRTGPDAGSSQQPTQSIGRALTILEAFGSRRPEVGVLELAQSLGVSPSSVSRLLATLQSRGYVCQDGITGRFRLGVRALELGYRFANTNELMIRAGPHLDAIARELGLNAHLYGLDDGQLIRYVSVRVPAGQALTGGFRFYAHTTAAGKVLLASLPDPEVGAIVARFGLPPSSPRSITTLEALRQDLATTRERGYGVDDEEAHLGTACLAVPIRDAAGRVIAAMSISGPASRLAPEQRSSILEALFDRADQLSQAMGYLASQSGGEPLP